jgi:hypothetical protein
MKDNIHVVYFKTLNIREIDMKDMLQKHPSCASY